MGRTTKPTMVFSDFKYICISELRFRERTAKFLDSSIRYKTRSSIKFPEKKSGDYVITENIALWNNEFSYLNALFL